MEICIIWQCFKIFFNHRVFRNIDIVKNLHSKEMKGTSLTTRSREQQLASEKTKTITN